MRMILASVFAYFFVFPVLAHAVKAIPNQYENCNSQLPGMGQINFYQPRLNAQGGLDVSSANSDVSGFERTDEQETVSVTSPGYPGSGQNYKTRYVLHKRDGKPDSLETVHDPKFNGMGFPGSGTQATKNVARYGYVNGRCYVKELSTVFSNGKEAIYYHHETCNDILAAAKGKSGKKLQECASVFSQIETAITRREHEIENDKRDLAIGFGGFAMKQERKGDWGYLSRNFNTMMAVSSCVMARKMYGYDIDPEHADLVNFGFGAFVGGNQIPKDEPEMEKGKDGGTTSAE